MGTKRKTKKQSRRPVLETIEPRILYSADFSPGLLDAAPLTASSEERALDISGEFAQATAPDVQQRRRDTEIVFVDVTTPDYDQLVQDIRARGGEREIEVVVLDVRKDGVKQITNTLTEREGVSALHIISHGADGSIQLGKTSLTFDSLLKNASQIKRWGQALTQEADLLIYGCDVAASAEGKSLIQALSRLTGADVAASDDATGAAEQGGDWELEYTTGLIDTRSAISLQAQLDWRGTLATYTVTSTANAGAGSLRQAITQANANAGTDTIDFNITGAGPHIINLTSTLPTINEAVILDGSTNPDFAGTPVIELRGAGTVANAFTVAAGGAGSTIRGFVLSGFSNYTIHLDGGNNLIAGNYIGTNAAGSTIAATPNVEGGIRIEGTSNNNTIGGSSALDRNIISGNGVGGNADDNEISVLGDNNVIIGNYIGVAADGTTVIGNPNDGVDVSTGAANTTIGGLNPGEGNRIAGHTSGGVRIQNGAIDSVIRGNTIWSNGRGVAISGSSTGHLIEQNSIYGNTNLGIDLGADDLTANDGAKTVNQPNLLMDFPVIQSASASGGTLTVTGYIGTAPNDTDFAGARVEFFESPDAAGVNGEGRTYLGFLPANASGNFSGSFAAGGLLAGDRVTATATDGSGNTSEFGVNVVATPSSNNAPVLANTVVTLNAINEDAAAPSGPVGTLISGLVGGVSDADSGALQGIAITAADASNGTWWYSINNGASWLALGTPSVTSARLLAVDANTRIYFQPNAQYHGTLASAITFRAWDRTSGSNGSTTDLTGSFAVLDQFDAVAYNGNNGAVHWTGNWQEIGESDGAATGNVFVVATGQVVNGPYLELSLSTAGVGLSRQIDLTGATSATLSFTYEQDTNSAGGQVALEVFDGSGWNTVQTYHIDTDFYTGLAGVYQSFDISAYAAANTQVRFRTVQAAAGDRFFADDIRIDYTGIGTGGTTAFSSATDTASLTVNPINDAPVASGSATLPGVLKDALNPPGTTVSPLFAGNYSDAIDGTAATALSGTALIGNAATGAQGAWQYSSDNVNWNSVPTAGLGDTSALVLPSSYYLRFLPAAGYSGTPGALTARLSDASAGAIGFSASSNISAAIGGTGNWSSASIAAGITVTAGNFAAYEDFNYASGGAGLSGSGGSGWGSAWNGAGAQTLITNGGLTSPGGLLPTNANGVQLNIGSAMGSANPSRDLSTSPGATSGTLWASFLLTPDRTSAFDYLGLTIGEPGQELFVGYTGANFKMNNAGGGGTNINVGGLVSGQTAFLVLRLDLSASGTDSATLYVNPTTGLAAPDVAGSAAKTDLDLGTFNTIRVAGGRGASANASIIDEIRFGDTYASVAPSNQAPAAADVSSSGAEDAASIAVTLSGSDADGTVQSFRLSSLPTNGTLYVDAGLTTAAATGIDYAATSDQRTLYFAPSVNWNGATSFQYVARDDDARLDISANTASMTITAVNDAPVLDNGGTMAFTGITEDDTTNGGELVSAIIASAGGDRVTDVDSGAVEGIAVAALVSGNGVWEYSLDGGGSWNPVGAVSDNSALLLRAADRLRFVPDGQNADLAVVSFRAWDQSSGTEGTKVDVSTNGGSTAFSSAVETANLTVTAVNDAPVLADTVVTLNAVNEDAGAPAGAVGTLVSALVGGISDVDNGPVQGVAVTAADIANGSWWYSTDGGASWNALGSPDAANSRLLAADALTRVYFQPNPDYNGSIAAALTFRAWDRASGSNGGTANTGANGGTTAFSSATDTAAITVNPVNDAPTITLIADQIIAEEGSTSALAFTVGDTETAPGSLTVTASSGNTTLIPNGNLVLAGVGANRTITVTPAANAYGGPVTITVSVFDGTSTTQETFDVTVIPVADTPGVTNAATDEDIQTTAGLVISRNAADAAEVTHFKITGITGGALYLNDGSTVLNDGDFITFAQGNAGLKFTPSLDSAVNGSFQVQASTASNDTGLGGAVANATIAIIAVNDEPSFTLGGNQNVNEDAGAQAVAGFASALPGGGADEAAQTFIYTVSNDNNVLFSVQPTIDGAGNLSYSSAADAFGSATVTVFVTDSGGTANGGDNTAPAQTFTVTVNPVSDAPAITLPGAAVAYAEDQAATQIDAAATVSDAEGNWAGGTLSVQITANAEAGDRLTIMSVGGVSVSVSGTDVLVGATTVGTTVADTVIGGNALTVTFNAAATSADVQAVVRAIGYYSSSQDPSTAARTVTFTVTDGTALTNSATETIGVTRVNDAPTLTTTASNPTYAQGAGAPVTLYGGTSASTVEAGQTFSQLVLTVSNLADGAAERLRIDGTFVALTDGNTATTAVNGFGVNVSLIGATATVTLTTTGASAAQMQALIDALAYENISGAPAGGPRPVTITSISDSGGTAGGGVDTSSLALASAVTVTTSGAIPVAVNDGYSVTEEGSLTVSGVSGWWDTSWQYRRQIVVDNLGRGQLTDFPILVALDTSTIDYAQTQNQGQDLRFVDGNGAVLAHEIELWNESGTSYVWVKVPVVDANSSSDYITMYYGNAAAADGQNADAVWNAAYVGVWHLNQAGSGAAGEFRDSSGTGNHGRGGAGTAADTPIQGSGQIGAGQDFDGSSDFIEVQSTASLQLTTAMTLEGWVRMDSFGVADVVNTLLRKGENNPNNYQLSVGQQTPFFTLDDGENTGVVAPSTLNAGQWYHLSATFDGTTRRLYVNGVQVASDAYGGPIGTDLRDLYIGGRPGTDFSDGLIDEARVSNTARSTDWIAAQYANVAGAGYLSFGAQESATGGGVLFNDSDADGQPLTAVLVAPPSSAAVFSLNPDGSFSYTPNANFAGTDTFTYRANDGTNNSNIATVTITVNPVNDEPSLTLAGNQTVAEDAGAQAVAGFAIPSAGGGADESVQTFTYTVSNNNNSLFSVQPTIDAGGNLSYALTANTFGSATVTVFVTDSGGTAGGGDDTSPSQAFTITGNPVADTPSVTNATTTEDTQTTSGLVINRNAADGAEVTHFKITSIAGGTLYLNDGTTIVSDGDFITFAQGNAGLKFTPSLNSTANGSFQVQGSIASNDAGLGGGLATASITVNPANDAPVVTAGAVTGYTENGVAVAIDNTIAVSDVDDTQIAGATVTISAGL
ncbi:MAG TPA: DUF2341 domain-containing protein, partial [Burkholderiales bacterium]